MQDKFDPLVAEWTSFVRNPAYNLVEKCLKMAQILEYPELNVDAYIKNISHMGRTLKEWVNDTNNPTHLIATLNEHMFGNLGFVGDMEDYFNPKNNFLNEVIDRRIGIPITISVLYVEIAKFIDLELKMIGFPGHVLVKYDKDVILDPFNGGESIGIDKLQEILDGCFAGRVKLEPRFLDEISPEKILIRMARNLKDSYANSYAYEKALRCTNMVLAIEPNFPDDIRDKGILESRMLNPDAALKYLNRYLEMNPDAEDADFVLELIREIRTKN